MKRYYFLIIFLYLLPIFFLTYFPFVDLPQHLHFAYVLNNFSNYEDYFEKRIFPMHNTFHLFFNTVLTKFLPLDISNRIYIGLIIILTFFSFYYFLTVINGEKIFSLLSLLVAYNYNLFWGFMGIAFAIPLIIFLFALTINLLKGNKRENLIIILLTILFIIIFLCHSLTFIYSFVSYLIILFLNKKSFRIKYLLPPLITIIFFFIPWQAQQFQREESEIIAQFKESISLKAIYQNFLNFWERLGIKTDNIILFFFKTITLLAIFILINNPQIFKKNKILSIISIITLSFYFFFPGSYTEAVFLNERFAPLIFLFLIAYLSLRLKSQILDYLILATVIINIIDLNIRFFMFEKYNKDFKKIIEKLEPNRKVVGIFYERKPKPDLFGYDVFLHFPCYYQLKKGGLIGFSFAYIRYSPLIFKENYPLERIDEWFPYRSLFPHRYKEYDYIFVTGEIRLSDEQYFRKMVLVDSVGIWRVYSVKE
ncbi:MAG: hypothetical protein N2323_03105 [candidate division WOR-3 bacterium]|nr:hypothetical protein [candidate division WOR-3 bacterium]MCX7836931.1 hypothetical protein [candidate division WOR-3 bacterium]MDW8114595.1 hypothetical protein [candidate division WOR-3 bacterium]